MSSKHQIEQPQENGYITESVNCVKSPELESDELKSQLLACQTYDDDYENKKKVGGFEAYSIWLKNQYHHEKNTQGMINLGTSVNAIIPNVTIEYLPTFLSPKDCAYPDPLGFDAELNPILSQDTGFKPEETFSFNNIESIVSLLSYHQKKVCFVGKAKDFDEEAVLSHSRASRCDLAEAELVVVLSAGAEQIKQIQQSHKTKVRLYVLASKQELENIEKTGENQAFTYQLGLKSEIQFCAAHTSDPKIINMIKFDWNFFHTSNITKRASLTPDVQIKIVNPDTEHIRKMIQIDSQVQVEQNHLWLVSGAGAGLNHLSRVLFNGGDLWTESPYYQRFDYDFVHSGIKMKHLSGLSESRTINNIKVAHEKGAAGYVVCNPNNPVGTKLTREEVVEICEWAQDKPEFHLIFDEVYLNVCRLGQTLSAASYAIKCPNIHVVRSMAKDFGLCGFKIGIVISSNPTVMQKFGLWKKIISHHPFTISVINEMLLASGYGQEIIKQSKVILKQYFDKILKEFDSAGIKYIKPEAGCFIFADLRDRLKESSKEAEEYLWKKIFYKYRVSISCGLDFHASEPGYFRICPMTDLQVLEEALKRIKSALLQK